MVIPKAPMKQRLSLDRSEIDLLLLYHAAPPEAYCLLLVGQAWAR